MTEEHSKYKFENLQPITFLRKFNKMIDDDSKQPISCNNRELRIFQLSKFPLPEFYLKMQGIFDTGIKKKDVIDLNLKSKDDVQDEKFFEKHRQFMTKAIEKIILDSENQQEALNQYRKQYDTHREVPPMQMRSEKKLKKNQRSKILSMGTETHRDFHTLNPNQSQFQSKSNAQQEPEVNYTYLQKVQKQRLASLKHIKKQKFQLRDNKKTKEFLESRRNFMSQKKQSNLVEVEVEAMDYDNLAVQDKRKYFIMNLMELQKQQKQYQREFGQKIEKQIDQFNLKISKSVQKVKAQKFW